MALEWGIPIVNAKWLGDMIQSKQIYHLDFSFFEFLDEVCGTSLLVILLRPRMVKTLNFFVKYILLLYFQGLKTYGEGLEIPFL